MSKEYAIGVYDMLFYRVDEDGNEELNKDGDIKLYRVKWYDTSHLTEGIEFEDLEEVEKQDD